MSIITALADMHEFRELKITRDETGFYVEMRLAHPDPAAESHIPCKLHVQPHENLDRAVMAVFGACAVLADHERHRGENVPGA
jgi:hypothetical protein